MRTISRHALLSALLAGALLPSCQLESYELPAEELYTRSFIKQFGVIDKNQDWNLAERKSVTVNPGSADQVKVYAYVGNTKYIFANYSDVKGTQTLEFDLPEGIEDIIVKVNGVEKTTKVGGTVEFSGVKTRGGHYDGDTQIKLSKVEDETHWLHFSEEALAYAHELPEGEYNLGKVIQNFTLTATDEFIIYPIYWQTNRTHTLGIYYFPNGVEKTTDNMVKVPIYTTKDANDDVFFRTKQDVTFLDTTDLVWASQITGKSYGNFTSIPEDDLEIIKNAYVKKYEEEQKVHVHFCQLILVESSKLSFRMMLTPSSYSPIGNVNQTYNPTTIPDYIWGTYSQFFFQSKGIKVSVPSGLEFGLYVDTGGSSETAQMFYSEEEFNPDYFQNKDKSIDKTKKACHASIFKDEITGWTLFGFEDWNSKDGGAQGEDGSLVTGGSDFDLNDFVCRIAGVNTTDEKPEDPPVDPDDKDDDDDDKDQPFAWLVACEDLGDTGDIDFNDIVFKVEYISGMEYATFTPLATGATLESRVYYNKNIPVHGDKDPSRSEIHTLLGGSAPNFINTTDSRGSAGASIILNVGKNFSMAYIGEEGKTKQNMGDFVIKTFGREKDTSTGWEAVTIVSGSDKGDAPMMICLPYEYEKEGKTYKWAWPKERVSIKEAYSGFEQWVGNSSYTDWYKYPNDGYVVTDPQGSSVTTTKTTK